MDVDISKDVLVGIAGIALESVAGVAAVTPPIRVGEVLAGKRLRGINVARDGSSVTVDLSVNIDYGIVIPERVRQVQQAVIENIELMTGLSVQAVNVTVQGIAVGEAASAAS
jgi:uncharacterized alkaline shock family protein YloU